MGRVMVVLLGASLVALAAPSVFESYKGSLMKPESERLDPPPAVVEASTRPVGRQERIKAGPDGHFRTDARLNGRPVPVLVDTGATYLAISEETARRVGLFVRTDDYRYTANTANGPRKVALAHLDRVEIGDIRVRDVDALVMKGGLSETLLGMSFLKKLSRYQVENGTLELAE
ncbi:retropepsin-like aspartic protease family protein [Consotaella salsifontis]|uniref:Aspartyl protease family protein n=1 Tax=Consotaella salsifontis TaxID=1365950 RepID=A0A1T4S1H4_9HYPH|nr:TIGR02281 family clan AA aspartic protease [Consotaella salsifontis]SKA22017.1 aspartyl protease family protein [Consotaella salsifontis]